MAIGRLSGHIGIITRVGRLLLLLLPLFLSMLTFNV